MTLVGVTAVIHARVLFGWDQYPPALVQMLSIAIDSVFQLKAARI
jgi:hypothetical protein